MTPNSWMSRKVKVSYSIKNGSFLPLWSDILLSAPISHSICSDEYSCTVRRKWDLIWSTSLRKIELDTSVFPKQWLQCEDDIINNHPVNEHVLISFLGGLLIDSTSNLWWLHHFISKTTVITCSRCRFVENKDIQSIWALICGLEHGM